MDYNEVPRPLEEPWYYQAACQGTPSELWFPERSGYRGGTPQDDRAKQICGGCPVRLECLADALKEERGDGRRYGVRGGFGPKERKDLQKRLAAYNREVHLS